MTIQTIYFGWFWLQYPILFIYGMFKPDYFKRWVKQLGYSQSQSGNAQMYPTLNLFVKRGLGKKFGDDIDESISHVSGVIKHEGRYNTLGRRLAAAHNGVYRLFGVKDHLEDARLNEQ